VLKPLKEQFDLIVLDCSPNWNLLTTNALVACDLLLSPLECKINNYRNFKMFDAFVSQFREEMQLSFTQVFVPTRLNAQRKLSREILAWYLENVAGVVPLALRECTAGEEAIASNLSTPEYAPGSPAAIEINQILAHVWARALGLEPQIRPAAGAEV
jgi:chromosome partitioning protein